MFLFCQAGSNPEHEAAKRRDSANYFIQPHLMVSGTPNAFQNIYLVLGDGVLVPLTRAASATNAVDLLLKTFFALNLHFPLGWKNAFRFIQVHVYEIPLENLRESSFDETLIRIKNTTL